MATADRYAIPMQLADEAVLSALEREILDPDVVALALEKACARLRPNMDTAKERGVELNRDISQLDAEIGRLTAAIAAGGPIESLVEEVNAAHRVDTVFAPVRQMARGQILQTAAAAARDSDRLPELRRSLNRVFDDTPWAVVGSRVESP